MQQAISLAKAAAIKGDVPVGALVVDDAGNILDVGSQLKAEGMVGEDNGQLIILNPSYEIIV